MPGLSLLSGLGGKLLIGVAIATLAATLYGVVVHELDARAAAEAAAATASRQLDQAVAVNRQDQAALSALKAETARELAAIAADRAASARRARRTQQLETEIAHAPAADDGPVASVLRRALDGLRGAAPAAVPGH